KKRAQQQDEIKEELRQQNNKPKATEPKKAENTPKSANPPSFLPAPPAPPPSFLPATPPPSPAFLPGATGDGPIAQAAKAVKNAETWAQQIEKNGTALVNRLGSSTSPTAEERQAFLNEEHKWRLVVKGLQNMFHENKREEAVNGLGELLYRFGPKFDQM